MAWIKVINEEEATGKLAELYEKYQEPWGGVDNIIKIHSLNVKSMRTHHDLYAHLMRGKSDLTRIQRERLRLLYPLLINVITELCITERAFVG